MPGKEQGVLNHTGGIETQLFVQVRTRLDMTQKEMAGMLSITPRQYGRIERGEGRVAVKTKMLFYNLALMLFPGATVVLPENAEEDPSWL